MEREGGPRFWVGSIECQVTTDGAGSYNPALTFPGIPSKELSQALTEQLDEKGTVLLPSNPLLIRAEGGSSCSTPAWARLPGRPATPPVTYKSRYWRPACGQSTSTW